MYLRRIFLFIHYKIFHFTSNFRNNYSPLIKKSTNSFHKSFQNVSFASFSKMLFKIVCAITAIILGFSLYYRTTNMWALKNLGDSFIQKSIGRRPIVIGSFHRLPEEQNVEGAFAIIQFVADSRQSHELYCISYDPNDSKTIVSTALIQRIHAGKRAASDVCAWSGHLAECEIASPLVNKVKLTTNGNWRKEKNSDDAIAVRLEEPLRFGPKKLDLVVCIAPLYIYTEWQILITGVETWLALGATKFVFPVQSASNDSWNILKEYERQGIAIIRQWPKWPVLSDTNPNGLVLSRGIEESHVNCLHFVKPFADMVVFTDIDDMLLPVNPLEVHPTVNVEILKNLFNEHPYAGSLLFEHRDVQFVLPESSKSSHNSLANFNFNFLRETHWKTNCKVWRMKTRVAVNASRVDTVNMHETGLHRFGYVQIRVPCRQAHFYHLRHSYKNIALYEWPIKMEKLSTMLNARWQQRLATEFSPEVSQHILQKSSTESFEDFDRCVMAITEEHFTLHVSRCMTPHVCFSKLPRKMGCMAVTGDYAFKHSEGDFLINLRNATFVESDPNCEAPLPKFIDGNYFYLP